jgi:hypothetical protein
MQAVLTPLVARKKSVVDKLASLLKEQKVLNHTPSSSLNITKLEIVNDQITKLRDELKEITSLESQSK